MKKLFFILLTILNSVVFALTANLKIYQLDNNTVRVRNEIDFIDNVILSDITVTDKINIKNSTTEEIHFQVFGLVSIDSENEKLGEFSVKPSKSYTLKSGKYGKFQYFIIKADKQLTVYEATSWRNDMDFILKSCRNDEIQILEDMETIVPDFSFQYKKENLDTSSAFVSSKIWLVDAFKDSKEVIQLEDKDTGIIMGKGIFNASRTNLGGITTGQIPIKFTFKLQIKQNCVEVKIYNFYSTTKRGKEIKYSNKLQFNEIKRTMDKLVGSYFSSL